MRLPIPDTNTMGCLPSCHSNISEPIRWFAYGVRGKRHQPTMSLHMSTMGLWKSTMGRWIIFCVRSKESQKQLARTSLSINSLKIYQLSSFTMLFHFVQSFGNSHYFMIDKITWPCAAKGLYALPRSQSLNLACAGRWWERPSFVSRTKAGKRPWERGCLSPIQTQWAICLLVTQTSRSQ